MKNPIQKILAKFNSAKAERTNFETIFQDIADLVVINRGNFNHKTSKGQNQVNNVFNNTAIEALNRLVGIITNGLTNMGSRWLNVLPEGVNKDNNELSRWSERVTNHLLRIFNGSTGAFYLANNTMLKSWASFGTGCLLIEEDEDGMVQFSTIHLSELYIINGRYNNIETVFRKFKITIEELIEIWGIENVDSKHLKIYDNDPAAEVEILHFVRPKAYNETNPKLLKFKYSSTYVDLECNKILSEKGFNYMPYVISRYDVFTGEAYGRSPVWDCLNEIKMLNVMFKDIIRAGQLSAIPPILTTGDHILSNLDLQPGMIIDGALEFGGQPNIATLDIKANLPFAMELVQFSIQRIRESFCVDQMYFKEGTPVTATEAVQRDEARVQAIAPIVTRLMSEYLNRVIRIVFDIEYAAGRIDAAPNGVDVKKLKIEYLSPLASINKMQDLQAVQRTLAVLSPAAQVDPSVFDSIKFNEMGTYIALASGMPASLVRTQKEIEEIMARRQQQQVMEQQQAQLAAFSGQLSKPIQ